MLECLKDFGVDAEIDSASTYSDALRLIKWKGYDLALIELNLHGGDGYSLAKSMRMDGVNTELVFISEKQERITEAFTFKPIGFWVRPTSYEQVRTAILTYMHYATYARRTFSFKAAAGLHTIPYSDILYFESRIHTIMLHSRKGETFSFTHRLDEVEKSLDMRFFVRTHQSYLVNLSHANELVRSEGKLKMDTGDAIPVSRSRIFSTIKKLTDFSL